MHTVIIVVGGLILAGLFLLAARMLNLIWVGVTRAGYSVAEELPIFPIIFAIPAAIVLLLWWKFS